MSFDSSYSIRVKLTWEESINESELVDERCERSRGAKYEPVRLGTQMTEAFSCLDLSRDLRL